MTTQTTVVGTPTLPRVNLLPPEIAEARTLQQYRIGAVGAVVLAAIGVGALYYHDHGGVASAQSSLDAANTKTASLNATLASASFQNVTKVKNQVLSAQSTLASALAPQVIWSKYLQDMSVSLPVNAWFTTMVMTSTGTAAAPAGAPTTGLSDSNPVGTIALSGEAVSHYDVADLLRSLALEEGLSAAPIVSSSAKDAGSNGLPPLVKFTVNQTVDSNGRATATTPPAAGLAGGTSASSGTAAGTGAKTPTTTPTKAAGN